MAYYVYILHCADGSYYTGHTEDLETRVYEHQEGTFPGYTKTRLPVELVFFDELPSRFDALDREKQIKGWSRAKKKALVDGDWEMLRKLSEGQS